MEAFARISDRLSRLVIAIGQLAKWLVLPLVAITVWDVITRKLVVLQQLQVSLVGNLMNSTKLQEMEWHLHTALFALCLGFGYLRNAHVRIDIVSEKLRSRTRAWIEFLGCLVFLIPYTCVVIYFGYDFAVTSFVQGEISSALIGVPHRWIIKSVLLIGMVLALLAGISIWLRYLLVLFGPARLANDPFVQHAPEEPAAET